MPPPGAGYPPQHPGWYVPQPGIIPLRPLTLSDIFSGVIRTVRTNPAATLGLTAALVVVVQCIVVAVRVIPLALTDNLDALHPDTSESVAALVHSAATQAGGGFAQALTAILLTGLITTVVGRAILGARTTAGQTWQRVRPRLLALLGYTLLFAVVVVLALAAAGLLIAAFAYTLDNLAATIVFGILIGLAALALAVWANTLLAFTPVVIVVERQTVWLAVSRSVALARGDFWRILGIRLLTSLLVGAVSGVIAFPMGFVAGMLGAAGDGDWLVFSAVLTAVATAVAQTITIPFAAGVDTLLYADRCIRTEGVPPLWNTLVSF